MTEENRKTERRGAGRPAAQRVKRVLADTTPKHLEQLTKQARALAGRDDHCLDQIHARLSGLKVKHEILRATLTIAKANGINERLLAEVGQAVAYELDSDSWNDGVIASLQERGRAQHSDEPQQPSCVPAEDVPDDGAGVSYQIGGKVVSSLAGGRICIRFDTSYGGEHYESYFCVLACKPSSERLHVSEHSIPFFLPLREVEKSNLSSSCTRFIDCLSDVLQAYVSRREQVRQLRVIKGDQIRELYHSLSYNLIEVLFEEASCKVGVSLAYDNPNSELPTRSSVLAWPHSVDVLQRISSPEATRSVTAHRLLGAEGALRDLLLPLGYERIIEDIQTNFAPSIHWNE